MGKTLVDVLKKSALEQKNDIVAFGSDFDWTLNNPNAPKIYRLFWENTLEFLPPRLKAQLQGYTIDSIIENIHIPIGWYLDMEFGYLVLANSNGEIMKVRRGNDYLKRVEILKLYGSLIDNSQPLDPDYNKPRFLLICDPFDYMEGYIKVFATSNGRPKTNIRYIDDAIFQAHHSENGFKKYLQQNPKEYEIKPNPDVKRFLEQVGNRYITFLLTTSPKNYITSCLNALGIAEYFDIIITDAIKPACFYTSSDEQKALWQELNRAAMSYISRELKPNEVFFIGDHLLKDVVSAKKAGFLTGLRMGLTHLREVKHKLVKYADMKFERDGHFIKPVQPADEKKLPQLSNFHLQIYKHADVLTTEVQNLEPFLLYR